MKHIKIIHVHFLGSHKNHYFGSIEAMYKQFGKEEIGVTKNYLRHYLVNDGNHYLNDKVLIIRSRLIR